MFRLCLCSALLAVIFVGCSKKKVADEQPTDDSADAVSTKTPAPEETTAVVDPLTVTKIEKTCEPKLLPDMCATLNVDHGAIIEAVGEVLAPPVADKAPTVDSSATGTMLMRLACEEDGEQNYLTTEPEEPDCSDEDDNICDLGDDGCICDYIYDCDYGMDECPREVTVVNGVATLFSQDNSYDISESVSIDGNCLRLHVTYDHDANPATAVKQVTGRVLLEELDFL